MEMMKMMVVMMHMVIFDDKDEDNRKDGDGDDLKG